ncbi:MAG TPA: hypothetical protein VMM12_13975 [Longimicrobiales bacterium]|nr:hypothetical protein [Longimicrobiales bacterium]
MFSTLNRGGRVAILAVAAFALGCENATEPLQDPALEVDGATDGLLEETTETLGSELSFAHRTVAQLTDEVVRELVGPEGGTLTLLGHSLTIPEGAVERPTMFVMAVLTGTEIQVELIAYDPDLYEDVGGKGFAVPVQLALSYAEADIDDPESLVIVHVQSDGTKVPLESEVDTDAQVVRADLDHFSRYALCGN